MISAAVPWADPIVFGSVMGIALLVGAAIGRGGNMLRHAATAIAKIFAQWFGARGAIILPRQQCCVIAVACRAAEIHAHLLAGQGTGDEYPRAVMVGDAVAAGAECFYAYVALHGVEL